MIEIKGVMGPNVVVGSKANNHEWLVGTTPVTELLYVDQVDARASIVGVKLSDHKVSDDPKGARLDNNHTRITYLISGGPWQQRFFNSKYDFTIILNDVGDYIAWEQGYDHEWDPLGDSKMLTVDFIKE